MDGLRSPLLIAMGALLVVAVVLRAAWVSRRVVEGVDAPGLACLRGGVSAVVVTALVALHLEGSVVHTSSGRVRTSGPVRASAPIERAVYSSLVQPMGPTALRSRPPVRRAFAALRRRMAADGLVVSTWRWVLTRLTSAAVPVVGVVGLLTGQANAVTATAVVVSTGGAVWLWLLPRRTHSGTRTLRAARHRYPQQDEYPDVVLAVALHGTPALQATVARFAKYGGLLDGGPPSDYTSGDGTIGMNSGVTGNY